MAANIEENSSQLAVSLKALLILSDGLEITSLNYRPVFHLFIIILTDHIAGSLSWTEHLLFEKTFLIAISCKNKSISVSIHRFSA